MIVAVRETHEGKEFLLVRHRDRGWELPGGKFEGNEGPVHCALREFREETGHLLADPHFVTKLRKENGLAYIFTGRLGSKVSEVQPREHITGYAWFRRLPRNEPLGFPDDPYAEMGKLIGIDFG